MNLQAKGTSQKLLNLLQIMTRITFMRLIDINYLLPLATFYNYTDLGQFGPPNIFNKMRTTTNTANVAHPTSSNGGGTNFFVLDTQGNVIFNSFFKHFVTTLIKR